MKRQCHHDGGSDAVFHCRWSGRRHSSPPRTSQSTGKTGTFLRFMRVNLAVHEGVGESRQFILENAGAVLRLTPHNAAAIRAVVRQQNTRQGGPVYTY